MPDTELGSNVLTKLNQLSEIAGENPTCKFTSLAHLLDERCLSEAFNELNHQAVAGIDGVTYEEYKRNLNENIADLVKRLKTKQYRATDIRRAWIPKPEGGKEATRYLNTGR